MKKLKFFLPIMAITGLAIAIPAKRLSIGSSEGTENVVSWAKTVIRASGPKEPMYTLPRALGLGEVRRGSVIRKALDSLLALQCEELQKLGRAPLCNTGLLNTIQGKVSALRTNNQAIIKASVQRESKARREFVQAEVPSVSKQAVGVAVAPLSRNLVREYNKNILAMRSLRCTSAFIQTGKEEYAVNIGNALQQVVISLKRMSAPLEIFFEESLDLRKPKTRVRKILGYQATLDRNLSRIIELHKSAEAVRKKISRQEPFSQQDIKALQSMIIDQEEMLGLEVPESLLPEVLVRDVLSNDFELLKRIAAIKVPKIF